MAGFTVQYSYRQGFILILIYSEPLPGYAEASISSRTARVNWWVEALPPMSRVLDLLHQLLARVYKGRKAQLSEPHLPVADNVVDSFGDPVGVLIQTEVP